MEILLIRLKKLLLLLLLSLSFAGSADTVTYSLPALGNYIYGDDGSSCYTQNNYLYCNNGANYPLSGSGNYIYGSDGSSCYFQGNYLYCNNGNNTTYGDTNAFMIGAYQGAYGMVSALGQLAGFQVQDEEGSAINDISNAIAEGIANEKASKAKTYSPPVINNSLRNTPFYNFNTTYEFDGNNNFYGSDGMRCSYVDDNNFSCNNGITYHFSNPVQVRGSDGTSYSSNRRDSSDDNYYCVTSSFGSKCCGNMFFKRCTKANETIPENATAQKEYIQKKEDKPKVADKTTTSSSKSSTNKTDKNNLLDYLLGALIIFLIAWYIFKDALAIFFPSLKRLSLKRLYKWLTRRRK